MIYQLESDQRFPRRIKFGVRERSHALHCRTRLCLNVASRDGHAENS